jgi:hypothetical protein
MPILLKMGLEGAIFQNRRICPHHLKRDGKVRGYIDWEEKRV